MKCLDIADVHSLKVSELGLDSSVVDLTSVEAIACALRRAASYLCPCASATLLHNIVSPLRGLVDDFDRIQIIVEETLEAIIAHGDLIELKEMTDETSYCTSTLLYAVPPSYIERISGTTILLGITSDNSPILPDYLESRIEYINHIRRISPLTNENLALELSQLGLNKISDENWLTTPQVKTPTEYLFHLDQKLNFSQPSYDVSDLMILDSTRSVKFYKGRWVKPESHMGRFIGRRKQAYGADLWSYIELNNGHSERLIDFPSYKSKFRGCDEAWYAQMAIDMQRGIPQCFNINLCRKDVALIELFSPLPMWARRRWDAIGEPVSTPGCLFAYRFSEAELQEELMFAKEKLWLKEFSGNKYI